MYLDKIIKSDNYSKQKGGFCKINLEFKDKIIENVIEIQYNQLYLNLLIMFYDNKIFNKFDIDIDNNTIEDVKYFLNNRRRLKIVDNEKYLILKYKMDSFFRLPSIYEIMDLFYQYIEMVFIDIIKDNLYNWLYIDTDCIFFAVDFKDKTIPLYTPKLLTESLGIKSVDKMNIAFSYEKHDLLHYSNKKQYITYTKNDFKLKGNLKRYNSEEIVSTMKTIIRQKKLDLIFKD